MKEKIVAKLKVKYPGLSNEMLGFFADKMLTTTTAEDQIDAGITALEEAQIKPSDFAAFAQQDADRRVNGAIKTAEETFKKKYNVAAPVDTPPAPETPPVNETPEVKALRERLEKLEKRETKQTLHEKLIKHLTEKKMPSFLAKNRSIETEDELTTLLAELDADWTEHQQVSINTQNKDQTPPPGSEGYKGSVDTDIKNWGEAVVPADKK